MEYASDFVDAMQALPESVQHALTEYKELRAFSTAKDDVLLDATMSFLEQIQKQSTSKQRIATLQELSSVLRGCLPDIEEKARYATRVYDACNKYVPRLDEDVRQFEYAVFSRKRSRNTSRLQFSEGHPYAAELTEEAAHTPIRKKRRGKDSSSSPNQIAIEKEVNGSKKRRRENGNETSVPGKAERNCKKRNITPTEYSETSDEPTYCLCGKISYGDMIACDDESCPIEWFHYACVGLTSAPKSEWYCPQCKEKKRR